MSSGSATDPWNSGQGSAPGPAVPLSSGFVRAPLPILAVSYAAAVVGLILGLLPLGMIVWILGWAIAAFIGLGAAVLFTQRDAIRQTAPLYLRVPATRWLYSGAIALSLVAIVVTALRVAFAVGRAGW